MRVEIIGVKKSAYKGKEGVMKTGYNYCGLKEFTRYELENADCEGKDIIREWSNIDFGVHPGDVVEFIYEPGFKDKATLVDVKVISVAGNPFPEQDTAASDKADKKPAVKAGA